VIQDQLYLSHASGAKGLGEGIVFQNMTGCVLLVGISFAFGMPRCCGMRLFPIMSWVFRRGTGMGGGVRLGRKGHGARFQDHPTGNGTMFGVFRG
jgi:hypothetical protein